MRTLLTMLLAAALTAGCGSLPRIPWPWSKPPPAAPAPVDELSLAGTTLPTIAQYWQGNTLVLDMTAVPAQGSVVATPTYPRGWPMRLAVRTVPGRFGALEVRGAQRAVLPLTTEGTGFVELQVPPGVHPPGTRELVLSWGVSIAPAVVFPQAPSPVPAEGPASGSRPQA